MQKPQITVPELSAWLTEQFNSAVSAVEPLQGGYWSTAFGFKVDNQDLVIRFNPDAEGFEIDRKAMQFDQLPVPKILEIGQAWDLNYALSERYYGIFLELSSVNPLKAATDVIMSLHRQSTPNTVSVNWYEDEPANNMSWREWLLHSLERASESMNESHGKDLVRRSQAELIRYEDWIPERRDLVHGDLLHQNVLVSDTAEVNALFSWKCSVLGDLIFDIAWFDTWAPWHPALKGTVTAANLFSQLNLSNEIMEDATLRNYLYTLQIGAHHLGWFTITDDAVNLTRMSTYLEDRLDKGP